MTTANLLLPRWAHVPGTRTEPDRDTLEDVKRLVPARFAQAVPHDHPALLYGLALNDRGFFWECHEILEAIWTAAPQGGRDRILLRACIQIANANLKQIMNQPRAVRRLLGEALAELEELRMREKPRDGFAAIFPAAALAGQITRKLADPADASLVMLLTHIIA